MKAETIEKGCDVVVLGGGVSGVMAAVAAARTGAGTILVEKNSFFGGTATGAMVGQFFAFYHNEQKTVYGLADELLRRLEAANGAKGFVRYIMAEASDTPLPLMGFPFDPEGLKLVLDEFVTEAGVNVLFCATLADVMMTGRRVTGVLVDGAFQRRALKAKCVVDASGDAVVADKAGVRFLDAAEANRKQLQPMTLVFRLTGVDVPKVRSLPREVKVKLVREGLEAGELYWKSLSFSSTPAGNDAMCLMSRVMGYDPLDDEEITRAYLAGRKQVKSIVQFLKRRVPGFENAVLVNIASQIGVRESRRIEGEYTVTDEDVLTAPDFPDSIAVGSGPYDIHDSAGTGLTLKMPASPFGIPYRCMIPKGVEGLIVTGRTISATRGANATIRHMGTTMALGHAAGTAAALSARFDRSPGAIEIGRLKESLADQGAVIAPAMLRQRTL
jgi:ribulose 1,5-bisphosphate synthetase/thiazole synthase